MFKTFFYIYITSKTPGYKTPDVDSCAILLKTTHKHFFFFKSQTFAFYRQQRIRFPFPKNQKIAAATCGDPAWDNFLYYDIFAIGFKYS